MDVALPCITPRCDGRIEWTAAGMWACSKCGLTYTNDQVKDRYTSSRADHSSSEDHFDPWIDEQRVKRQLIPPGHGSRRKQKFKNRKRMPLRPWYQR